jgi:hypothetical protein
LSKAKDFEINGGQFNNVGGNLFISYSNSGQQHDLYMLFSETLAQFHWQIMLSLQWEEEEENSGAVMKDYPLYVFGLFHIHLY